MGVGCNLADNGGEDHVEKMDGCVGEEEKRAVAENLS